jgi:hypothetical protein
MKYFSVYSIFPTILHTRFFPTLPQHPNPSQIRRLDPPKSKTKPSRRIAFNALFELVTDCPINLNELTDLITETHLALIDQMSKEIEWNYFPAEDERSSVGYTGLRNLGSTCYMNSLLQQLVTFLEISLIFVVYDA